MNCSNEYHDVEPIPDPSGICFAWDRLPRGKSQIKAYCGGEIFHCDAFKIDDSKERSRFLADVIGRAREQFDIEADVDTLELSLLAIIEEQADRPAQNTLPAPTEFQVVEDQADPDRNGLYAVGPDGPVQLSNATIYIDRDVTIDDGPEPRRRFEGRVIRGGEISDFGIDAEDYAHGPRLAAAIFTAAGAKVQILCRPEVLGRAISDISEPTRRVVSTDFGWTPSKDVYLTPSVRVDAAGIHATGANDTVRVDLGAEQCARHLDLAMPAEGELDDLKRHVLEDLLELHDRRVTCSLLAAAALGVLYQFVTGMNRPAIWLVGLTGGGKSFAAKLFQSFFGDFPIEIGAAVGSWSSTPNFLQRQGYYFKDSTYLIDDYKTEVTRHAEVVRLLQNYADGSARGRLNSDATTNLSREIRAILVCTGEAIPEQSPSSMARTVIVDVLSCPKDVARGERCLGRRLRYPALMAGFIHRVIVQGRGAAFVARVKELQGVYYGRIAGAQNDLRIAGNLALLGAAFEEIATYLEEGSVDWAQQVGRYVDRDLSEIRDKMITAVKEQQPSEIFLSTLGSLVENHRVRIDGWLLPTNPTGSSQAPTIGRTVGRSTGCPAALEINMGQALEAVQESLRKQGRPPLAMTHRGLLDQLAVDGRLLDQEGRTIRPGASGRRTYDVNLAGTTKKVFRVAGELLIGPEGSPAPSSAPPAGRPDG